MGEALRPHIYLLGPSSVFIGRITNDTGSWRPMVLMTEQGTETGNGERGSWFDPPTGTDKT